MAASIFIALLLIKLRPCNLIKVNDIKSPLQAIKKSKYIFGFCVILRNKKEKHIFVLYNFVMKRPP